MSDDNKQKRDKKVKRQRALRDKVERIVLNQDSDLKDRYCSFCGKGQSEVQHLVEGPAVYICNECIAKCNQILVQDTRQ